MKKSIILQSVLTVFMFLNVIPANSQEFSLAKIYTIENRVVFIPKYSPLYDSIALGFYRKYEMEKTDYILSMLDKKLQPEGFVQAENTKIIRKYVSFYVDSYWCETEGNESTDTYYFLFVPSGPNSKMPVGFRPDKSFVFPLSLGSFTLSYKKRQDFSKYMPANYLCTEFVFLPRLVDAYLVDNMGELHIIRENQKGDMEYSCDLKIPGFSDFEMVKTKTGYQYVRSIFNIDNDADRATEIFDKMVDALYTDGENPFHFEKLSSQSSDYIKECTLQTGRNSIRRYCIVLRLQKDENKGNYSVVFELRKFPDNERQKQWVEMGEKAMASLQAEGYNRISSKTNTDNIDARESYYPDGHSIIKWILYVDHLNANPEIKNFLDEFGKRPVKVTETDGIWCFEGETVISPDNHTFFGNIVNSGKGRWALYTGMKQSLTPEPLYVERMKLNERKLEEQDKEKIAKEEALRKEEEKWEKVVKDITKSLRDSGYTNIDVKRVGRCYSQKFQGCSNSSMQGSRVLMVIATPYPKFDVYLYYVDGYVPFNSSISKDVFFHALQFDDNKVNGYTYHFKEYEVDFCREKAMFFGTTYNENEFAYFFYATKPVPAK